MAIGYCRSIVPSAIAGTRDLKQTPEGLQNFMEYAYEFLQDIAKNQIVLARRHNQTKISLDIDGLTEKTLSELKNIQMERL